MNRLIQKLSELVLRNQDYPYLNHHRDTYHNIPLWVLMNAVTFGSLSKFYALMTHDLQAKVAQNFAGVNERQLEQYLNVITKFRNVCAHNERLFSYQTYSDIPDTTLHQKLGIPQTGTQYVYGKRDLFALVIALRYLLPNEDFKKFKQQLVQIIRHYFKQSSALTESELLGYMGFPENWGKITVYRK